MSNLKKLFIFLTVFAFCSTAAFAVEVSSQAALINAINSNAVSNIVITSSFSMLSNMPSYSSKTVNFSATGGYYTLDGNGKTGLNFRNSKMSFNDTAAGSILVFSNFKSTAAGGAMYFENSTITSGWVDIIDNEAENGGGIYLKDSDYNSNWTYFWENTALNDGGVIYSVDSSVDLSSASVILNVAANNGGAVFAQNSDLKINDAGFAGNYAGNDGGAIYASSTSLNFYDVYFLENEAKRGSAVYAEGSSGIIELSSFSYNSSVEGTVYISSSNKININDSYFYYNDAQKGAGVYVSSSSKIDVLRSKFEHNEAEAGAAGYFEDSDVSLTRSTVWDNTADLGSAFYVDRGTISIGLNNEIYGNAANDSGTLYAKDAMVSMENSIFRDNTAAVAGGAVYAENSTVNALYMSINNNTAADGGGIYLKDSSAEISYSQMSGNTASGSGGAVYVDNSKVTVNGGEFRNNTASGNGGAFYLSGASAASTAQLTINSGAVFSGNTAGGKANDIYMDENSVLNINASGADIVLAGGITQNSAAANTVINKTGSGKLIFSGGENYIYSPFNFTQGTVAFENGSKLEINNIEAVSGTKIQFLRNTQTNISDTFSARAGSVFVTEGIDSFYADKLNMSGTLQLGLDMTNNKADLLTAGDIVLDGGSSALKFDGNLSKGSGSFTFLRASNSVSGQFSQNQGRYGARVTWNITYDNNDVNVDVDIKGYDELDGFSKNQTEVVKAIDLNYETAFDKNNLLWNNVISPMDGLSEDDLKKTADMLSGSFYADLFTLAASNAAKNTFFGQLRLKEKNYSNAWSFGFGNFARIEKDENIIDDLEDTTWGVRAGWDIYNEVETGLIGGFMLGYTQHDVKQDDNSAMIYDFNVGPYGAYFTDLFEIKAALYLGLQSYETTRRIKTVQQNVYGNFIGLSANFDIQAALTFALGDAFILRPFADLDFNVSSVEDFTERGKGAQLHVDANTYFRSTALAGLGFRDNGRSNFNWYIDAGIGCLLSGKDNEVKTRFSEGMGKMTIEGAEQGAISANVGAGIEFVLSKAFNMFANAGYTGADGYDNMYANVGLRCKVSYYIFKNGI